VATVVGLGALALTSFRSWRRATLPEGADRGVSTKCSYQSMEVAVGEALESGCLQVAPPNDDQAPSSVTS
jgi:hypothetical protein